MKYPKMIFTLFIIVVFLQTSIAQHKQTIRGQVIDTDSRFPIIGANIIIPDSDPFIGTSSDVNGRFEIKNVPIGKIALKITSIGYKDYIQQNIIVVSGKETTINAELEETVIQLEEATVTAQQSSFDARNDIATVSIRTFDAEQTSRFAGSRNDPGRMAANYAGVSGANDSRNDVVIRGNSPAGVLWRIEGIDVPNPNHFASFGSTGGPVSMLNNNVLEKSDFMTSAFPSEYGNALSGVFDLYLRNGNTSKHEFLGQIGFNGFEFGSEGPTGITDNSSYIANYRYSTLAVFNSLGIDFGTGTAVPYYQDLNFKINLPTKNTGTFSLFGIGGLSNIDLLGSDADLTSDSDLFGNENEDLYSKSKSLAAGLSQTYFLSKTTFYKLALGYTIQEEEVNIDSINIANRKDIVRYVNIFNNENKFLVNFLINSKIDSRNNITAGFDIDFINLDFFEQQLNRNLWYNIKTGKDNTQLYKSFVNLKHKFDDNLTLNAGLHFINFALNSSNSVEPRAGLSYNFSNIHTISLGYGLHSQIQPLPTYYTQGTDINGSSTFKNKEMDFTKSHHIALGYEIRPSIDFRIKAETYYQHIYNVPVESTPSSFSMLNAGADFGTPDKFDLVNEGKGENYGVELTAEKTYSEDYYALITVSLFESKYQGSDKVWRNSAFNGNYVFNVLGGKEFKLGNDVLSIDLKATFAGGRYYSPVDFAKSALTGREEIIDNQAYSLQYDPYFRTDVKVSYRINTEFLTHEISLDIQNITNRRNVFRKAFNRRTGDLSTEYQLGLFPMVQYRILFWYNILSYSIK